MAEERDSLIEFPCEFAVKAMGRADPDFVIKVVDIMRRIAPAVRDDQVLTTASKRGSYVSVTVTFTAESQAQLDHIYLALNADECVLMTL